MYYFDTWIYDTKYYVTLEYVVIHIYSFVRPNAGDGLYSGLLFTWRSFINCTWNRLIDNNNSQMVCVIIQHV